MPDRIKKWVQGSLCAVRNGMRKFAFRLKAVWERLTGSVKRSRRKPEEETDHYPSDIEDNNEPELPADTARVHRVAPEKAGSSDHTKLFNSDEIKKADTKSGLKLNLEDEDEPFVPEPLFVERVALRPFPLAVLFTSVKFLIIIILLIGCAGLGAGLGIARAYVETTPSLDTAKLTKSDRTSFIYDKNGDLITSFANLEYRDWADIEDIPDMLKNAVIAVEDVRFYKHEGLDYKRLFSAVINTLRNSYAHGGSTITQQLIKNKILTSEQTYKRKIQEAYLALELERMTDKDIILEAYLNDVYLGESNYGVKTASQDYFGKALDELTVRECAMLAGLINKPYTYNPRTNMYKRKDMTSTDERTDKVLRDMYEAGFITKEQLNAALAEEVKILEVSAQKQMYDMPYFVEYAIRDVIDHLLLQRGMLDTIANRAQLENELSTGGYRIYTTVDPKIQHIVQETLSAWEQYPALADPAFSLKITTNADGSVQEIVQPQASAVVFDYHTGELRAVVGGRDTPTRKKELNRAYQSDMPIGSSIKPLAVYGPALDLGVSPATIIHNMEGEIEGYGGKGYPSIGSERWIGPVTVRRGVVSSLNVVAARTLFEYVTPEVSKEYLVNLGVDPSRINMDGPGLALGTSGFTPIEAAAAYGAIASGGEYKEPFSFTKVLDAEGNVILDSAKIRKNRQVFKKSTAYLLVDMLMDAVKSGTGTEARIDGMTVAGKTGTNSDYSSVYFAGMTPYYTAALWIGHDDYTPKLKRESTGGRYAAPLWKAFMEKIHEGLANAPIIDESPGNIGLVKRRVCSVSGLLATDACELDSSGHTPVTDWFVEEYAPTASCDMHVVVSVCGESGQQASTNCPEFKIEQKSVVLISSDSPYIEFERSVLKDAISNAVFTDIPIEQYRGGNYDPSGFCTLHGFNWSYASDLFGTAVGLISEAEELIRIVKAYMNSTPGLTWSETSSLNAAINNLEYEIIVGNASSISSAASQLTSAYNAVVAAHQDPYPTETPDVSPLPSPGPTDGFSFG
ncbi:MAG: Penicillin-binding protein 1A [Firmicutes bacterium ADurb.Bin182]|nr:MAG: Penicillin-binding protein 1A [Firmicutes bacterium ADurb.Bin182]